MRTLKLNVEELEERIAPQLVTITVANPGVTGSGTLDTDAGTASGTLTISQTGETLSGTLTLG